MSDRIRVASLQYFIRPVSTFEEFREQVVGLIETAADYKCRLVVIPEYFTIQLLTLGDLKRPMPEQVRALAQQRDRYVELLSGLARRHALYIAGGTIPAVDDGDDEKVFNECCFFAPSGEVGVQGKLHMTRFEVEDWLVSPRSRLKVFDTDFGTVAITICYDVEFPELARAAARSGANIILAPSCTDDRQGYFRVRYCAHARAIENQVYVIVASTVGSLPMVPAVSMNWGQAAILTPSDFSFSRDGILAEGTPNQEMMVIGELNLETIESSRTTGTVLPLNDSARSAEIATNVERVRL